jgi:cytoskeletal protein RodZ
MPENDPQSHSELASFGEELRREREIRGISLKEIADATKISKRFLEAIERNDHKTLPAPVFTRGFVREYARYLGLNFEEMVNRYNFAAAGDDRIDKSFHLDQVAQLPVHPDETRREPKRGIPPAFARVDRNIWVLLVIVAVLAAVIWFAVRHKKEAPTENEIAAHPVAPARVPANGSAVQSATAPAAADTALHLVIDLTEASWIALDVDGKTVLNDEIKKGEHRAFDAQNEFRFKTVGNAGGVKLTLNGVPIPPLGPEGKVLHDRVFDRSSVEAPGTSTAVDAPPPAADTAGAPRSTP